MCSFKTMLDFVDGVLCLDLENEKMLVFVDGDNVKCSLKTMLARLRRWRCLDL